MMPNDRPNEISRSHRSARHTAAWLVALALLALAVLPLAGAQGVSQEAALSYRDAGLVDLEARVDDAERVLRRASGFGYSTTFAPRVSVTNRLGADEDATWSTRIAANASVTYRYDGVALVREERDLERARFDLDSAQRDGVFQALRAHVTWWNQARARLSAATRLDEASTSLAEAEAAFERGEIDRDRMAELQLAFDRADLAHREASYRYADARTRAADFGLRGTPVYQPLRFALPEPDLEHLFAVRSRQVALDEAEAMQLRAELFRVPKEVRLSGSYATENLVAHTEVGMFDRTPGADVTLSYPGATNPNWTIGLRAEFVIDNTAFTNIDTARQRVEDAQKALTDYLASYPDEVRNARQLVAFAEENLSYAERALDLDERRLSDLDARLDDTRTRLEAAAEDDVANLEREVSDLQRDRDRSLTSLDRSEGALLGAWNTYIGQVNTYLRLVQGGWELR